MMLAGSASHSRARSSTSAAEVEAICTSLAKSTAAALASPSRFGSSSVVSE
jgi:hypothetical protein